MERVIESTSSSTMDYVIGSYAEAPPSRIYFDAGGSAGVGGKLATYDWTETASQLAGSSPKVSAVLIHGLGTKRLRLPLSVLIELDGDDYIAQTVDFPLYGAGSTPEEAVAAVQADLESLYDDLMQDDQFSDEWLNRKKLLAAIVVP